MQVKQTSIPGLLEIELDVFGDDRGNFREVYQEAKLRELGFPEIKVLQSNFAESKYGVIRGIHVEPWDKYIHVGYGEAFAAIVDVRTDEPTFGTVETFRLTEQNAIFVPEGLGNSYAVVSDVAVYNYLVTDHWSADKKYGAVAYDDSDLAIDWPVPEADRIISEKDQKNPSLREAYPR